MAYMSGRSLHPISLNLACKVTEELNGDIAISYCGGADAENYADLIADGLGPVTLCSDLLKPGGYARMNQFLDNLEAAMDRVGAATVDELPDKVAGEHHDGARGNLRRHAARALTEKRFQVREKPLRTKSQKQLSWFDCSSAPCVEACPAHQNVPEYLVTTPVSVTAAGFVSPLNCGGAAAGSGEVISLSGSSPLAPRMI